MTRTQIQLRQFKMEKIIDGYILNNETHKFLQQPKEIWLLFARTCCTREGSWAAGGADRGACQTPHLHVQMELFTRSSGGCSISQCTSSSNLINMFSQQGARTRAVPVSDFLAHMLPNSYDATRCAYTAQHADL